MAAPHETATREAVIALYGKTPCDAVAKQFGLSRNTVISMWRRAREAGLKQQPRANSHARIAALEAELEVTRARWLADNKALAAESRLAEDRAQGLREMERRCAAAEAREADLRRERNALVVAMAGTVVGGGEGEATMPRPIRDAA